MQILLDNNLKPQARQLQLRVDSMLKILNKFVAARVSGEVKVKQKKKAKVKNEHPNSMEVSTNGNEAEAGTTTGRTKRKPKAGEEAGSKSRKEKKSSQSKDKEHKKKKKRKRDITAPAMHYTASSEPQLVDGDLSPNVFAQCKERMRPVKKALKQLDNPNKEASKEENEAKIRKCLLKIGERVTECLNEIEDLDRRKEWRNNLWTFVSKFTEFDPKKLYKIYKHTVKKQNKELDRHQGGRHHSKNGESSNHQSGAYSYHSNNSQSSGQSFYQSKMNSNSTSSNKFNATPLQQRHPPAGFQSKEPYHSSYSEKRSGGAIGLQGTNSPNKRMRPDEYSQPSNSRSLLNSTKSPLISTPPNAMNAGLLVNRPPPNNAWHSSDRHRHANSYQPPQRNHPPPPPHSGHPLHPVDSRQPRFRSPYPTTSNAPPPPISGQLNYYPPPPPPPSGKELNAIAHKPPPTGNTMPTFTKFSLLQNPPKLKDKRPDWNV